jgi:hypothetical protein
LDSEVRLKELPKALNLMKNNKSPGPDGIVAEFYKMYWSDVRYDFYNVVLNSQRQEALPHSHIWLS